MESRQVHVTCTIVDMLKLIVINVYYSCTLREMSFFLYPSMGAMQGHLPFLSILYLVASTSYNEQWVYIDMQHFL